MKIIQVMPEFGLAGAETMCENLTYELEKLGHQVIVVSLYDYHSPITDRLESKGIKIIYLNKKPGLDLSIILKLRNILMRVKPDIIHTHRYVLQYSLPAAVLAGVKRRIHTVHNIAKKENTKIARLINKVFYKYFNVIPVALSEEIQKTIIDEYGLKHEMVPIVFNGINLEKCLPKIDYSINKKVKILHVGRFTEQKNHRGLLEAFKKYQIEIPDSELQLVGDGEKKADIIEYIEKNGLKEHVTLLGLQDDVYTLMQQADIFILPSLYEGLPMTLLEAMGTGLPIIASRVGGIPDILSSSWDCILTSLDTDEIAKALITLSKNEDMRETYGKNAKKRSEDYSAKQMAEKYCLIYKTCLK